MFRRTVLAYCAATVNSGPFDPHKILGVRHDAKPDEIKKAYHKLALRFHPDGGPEGNKERFQAVQEAYDALKGGKWAPSSSSAEGGSHKGWDPKRSSYVYEEPGSTSENYVSTNKTLEWQLKLLMGCCFAFIVVRMAFFYLYQKPLMMMQQQQQSAPDIAAVMSDGVNSSSNSNNGTLSIHDEDDREFDMERRRREAAAFETVGGEKRNGGTVFIFNNNAPYEEPK